MKFSAPLALISITTLLPLLPSFTPSVKACTIVDATTQVAIHGSRTPAQQQNTVTTASDNNCFNNTAVGTTTQVGVSSGQVKQSNEASYYVGGGDLNNTGLTTPNVTVTPQTQVDIYSPAHDPEFLKHLRP